MLAYAHDIYVDFMMINYISVIHLRLRFSLFVDIALVKKLNIYIGYLLTYLLTRLGLFLNPCFTSSFFTARFWNVIQIKLTQIINI